MQDEQEEQTGEAAEATADDDTGAAAEGADDTAAEADADDGAAAEDSETAEAVDMQASPGGAGETVLKQPEVPDDANDKIAAAQEHINSLNMDEERKAAERAAKNT
jgi:hypothetical protein